MAHLRPPAVKMMIFHWFLKAKIRKTLNKRYVLKATNGKTATRIKKISPKRKRTTTGRFWESSLYSSRKHIFVKIVPALEGEPLEMVGGSQQ